MATATSKKTVKTVMKPVKEEVVTSVTLTLDADEAQFLADVLAKVGGDPTYSRRRYQTPISTALRDAGVSYQYPIPDTERGTITFNDDIPGNPNKR